MKDKSHVDLKLTKYDFNKEVYWCPNEEFKINNNQITFPNMGDKNNCVNRALKDLHMKFNCANYLDESNQLAVKVKVFDFIPFTCILDQENTTQMTGIKQSNIKRDI